MRLSDQGNPRIPRALVAIAMLAAAMVLLAPAASPEVAAAQTTCGPNGDDTYTPSQGGTPPPGSVIVGPGESCPSTDPVDPAVTTPTELPPPPDCPKCPEQRARATHKSGGDPADPSPTPVSYTGADPPVARLPFTGLDAIKRGLLLGGLGLLAIGLGLGLRRFTSQPW